MTKQVNKAASTKSPATNGNNPNNLYISVKTFDAEGRTVGERIVDQYHYGTANWLRGHLWWAMHHSNSVEIMPATPEEIVAYLESGKAALAAKFNTEQSPAEPVAIAA